MVKAIFLDIDGTLRDECSGVPQSAYTAVRMCRERGIRILICTGRNLASIQEEILSMDTDGIIAGGGCLIAENGYVQKKSYFQKPETERIQEYLLTRELPFAMESQERIFMNRAAAVLLRQDFIGKLKGLGAEEIRKREKENSIPYEDTLKEYMHSPDHIHKFCLWCRPEDWEAVCATVPGWGAVVQQSAPTDGKIRKWGYLELQPAGCTKGQAIRWWCRRNGIRLKDTMSFGDGKNDVDMIRTTGIGVAMEDGDEELKQWADSLCRPAARDGIYRELVRRGIIG